VGGLEFWKTNWPMFHSTKLVVMFAINWQTIKNGGIAND
jgi:hypothetical protein